MKTFFVGIGVSILIFSFLKPIGGCEFYFYALVVADTCYVSEIEFCRGSKVSGGIEGIQERILKRNAQAERQNFRTRYKCYQFSNGLYTRGKEEEKHTTGYMQQWREDFLSTVKKERITVVEL